MLVCGIMTWLRKANQITSKKICTNILIKRIRYEMFYINLHCQYLHDLNSLKVGHNRGDEFTFHWWDHVFNKAASSIVVESTQVWYSTILYVYMYKTCIGQYYVSCDEYSETCLCQDLCNTFYSLFWLQFHCEACLKLQPVGFIFWSINKMYIILAKNCKFDLLHVLSLV